ncbi:MAG: hypothetical protein LC731_04920 [Acidobacteria bacterium]|nr:hypothetical protein [Acidobacteriota bacterium]
MSRKDFYFCEATLKGPVSGFTSTFRTYAIAGNQDEAVAITTARAEDVLPAGWEITSISAIPFQRDLLEKVAEEVLGWERPDWVS